MSEKRVVYLSHTLSERTQSYGNGGGPKITQVNQIASGDSCNQKEWTLSNHVGTHVDVPNHFFDSGATVDSYPPDFWLCSKVSVIHLPLEEPFYIKPEEIEHDIDKSAECLLIRTGFQRFRGEDKYHNANPGLSPELGHWLRSNCPNLKFVGMDFISISSYANRPTGREAHKAFLDPDGTGQPVLPIEDMDFSKLRPGDKITSVLVFPLMVEGADGAPATVVASLTA